MIAPRYGDLADALFNDIVAPDFREEVRDSVYWRFKWRKISNWVEGFAHVLLGLSSILAFTAGFYQSQTFTYIAACCSTVCLSMLRFSTYAKNESNERNAILTRLLSMVGIAPMPTNPIEPDSESESESGSISGGSTPRRQHSPTFRPASSVYIDIPTINASSGAGVFGGGSSLTPASASPQNIMLNSPSFIPRTDVARFPPPDQYDGTTTETTVVPTPQVITLDTSPIKKSVSFILP